MKKTINKSLAIKAEVQLNSIAETINKQMILCNVKNKRNEPKKFHIPNYIHSKDIAINISIFK